MHPHLHYLYQGKIFAITLPRRERYHKVNPAAVSFFDACCWPTTVSMISTEAGELYFSDQRSLSSWNLISCYSNHDRSFLYLLQNNLDITIHMRVNFESLQRDYRDTKCLTTNSWRYNAFEAL
jgi:hypothetical protein